MGTSILTPLLFYVTAALVFTWPLALHPVSHLAAPVGPGDPFLNLWILGWGMHAIVTDPWAVLTGTVFDANIFYPASGTLAYSDHLLAQSAVMAPLYAVTRDVVLCYNVLLFVSLVASAVAMHAFVKATLRTTSGAYLGGVAWAFWPYRFAHLLHLQLQSLYFLPLAFLLLHRVMAGREKNDAVGLGFVAGLQAISSVYYAVIGAVGLITGAIALALAIGRWRSGVVARRLLLALVVAATVVMPAALTYWRVQQNEGFGRNLYQASRNAALMGSYAQVPESNLLYGRTRLLRYQAAAVPVDGLPTTGPERELFPGFVIVVLAAAGIVLAWRSDAHPIVVAMLTVGALGFVLSLGPDGMRPLYAFFHRFIFGFQAIRAPARFAVLAMFAMTTLAALGWRELTREAHKARRRSANHCWGVAIIALMALEFVDVPIPMSPAPARQTDIGRWLERASGPGPVIYLPLGLDVESTPAMVQSLEHRRPIVNGYSGQRPAFYAALVDTLSGFPSDDALLALKEIGVRFAVTKKPLMPPSADAAWPLVERARFADGLIYEFHWTPELDERLRAAATVTPPVPGIVPFRPGERATYAVRWAGAVDLPAGQITVRVERPDYTFLVGAESAPWVARFFEAKDAFTTRAGPDLLPELHERDQKEGARHETRVFVYDHARGLVHLGRTVEQALGSEGVNLPLPAGSRDAISALFYVRTLPLEPGARYAIPVNEAGRNLVVDVVVTGRESVQIQGKSQEAIRIEPRVRRPAERRRPGIATIWLSADARRVPLAFDVEASFGKVRIELVSYDRR